MFPTFVAHVVSLDVALSGSPSILLIFFFSVYCSVAMPVRETNPWAYAPDAANKGIAATHSGKVTTHGGVPSSATDTYVKRVLKYYEKYKELYTPSAA